MQVKLRTKLSDTDEETGTHYRLAADDVVTVPDSYGRKLCDRGWAEDTSGAHASAPLVPGAAAIDVQKAKHVSKARTKGKA